MKPSRYLMTHPISSDHSLLLNGLTGAVDIVDRTVSKALAPGRDIGSLDPDVLRSLRSRGHVAADVTDETRLAEAIFKANSPRRRMLKFSISPTLSCNLRCTYCFEKNHNPAGRTGMRLEDVALIFKAVDDISSKAPELPRTVSLFGGEPLLVKNRRLVDSVLGHAASRGLSVSIVTNGVNLPLYMEELREFSSSVKAQVTLDGPKRIHDRRRVRANGRGSFSAVVEGVDLLISLRIPVNLRVNVDAETLPFLSETAKLIEDRGWPGFDGFICSLAPVTDHTGTAGIRHLLEEWELLVPLCELFEADSRVARVMNLGMFRSLNHLKRVFDEGKSGAPACFYCEANTLENFEFGPDGLIYACSECIGDPEHAIGRYRPEFELFRDKTLQWSNRNIATMDKCRGCEIAFLCGGGCAYSALKINGSLYEPHCGSIKKLIAVYLENMGKKILARAGELSVRPLA